MQQKKNEQGPGRGPDRRARERRGLVALNLALLLVAVVVAAPRTVRAIAASVREERECAAVRSALAGNDVRALEQGTDVDRVDPAAWAALDALSRALDKPIFEVLGVRGLVETIHELSEARRQLAELETVVNDLKASSQALERYLRDNMPGLVGRLTSLAKVCMGDPSARADCDALARLPTVSFGTTKTPASARRRLDELSAQYAEEALLAPQHPRIKAVLAEDVPRKKEFIDQMRSLLEKTDALDRDQHDEPALRRTVRAKARKLRQQLAGMRVYCDAPLDRKEARR